MCGCVQKWVGVNVFCVGVGCMCSLVCVCVCVCVSVCVCVGGCRGGGGCTNECLKMKGFNNALYVVSCFA